MDNMTGSRHRTAARCNYLLFAVRMQPSPCACLALFPLARARTADCATTLPTSILKVRTASLIAHPRGCARKSFLGGAAPAGRGGAGAGGAGGGGGGGVEV